MVLGKKLDVITKDIKVLERIPYESQNKYSAVFYEKDGNVYCTVKGYIEKIVSFCSDANLISNALKKVIKELESKLGSKIEQVLAIVPSNNIDINITMAEVSVKTEGNIIDGETIFSCLQKSLKNNVLKDISIMVE